MGKQSNFLKCAAKVKLRAVFVGCEVCLVEALRCINQSCGLQASQCSGAHLVRGMCGSARGWFALWKSLTELLFLGVFALKVTMFGLLVFQKGLRCAWLLRSDFRRVVKENSIYSPVSRWISIKCQL